MREQYTAIARLLSQQVRFSVATLTATRNSTPAPVGTCLLVFEGDHFAGNIGAGCHEAEIIEAGRLTLADGRCRFLEFGMNDELLDGSVCGATLSVIVWKPAPDFLPLANRIAVGNEMVTLIVGSSTLSIPPKRRLVIVGAIDLAEHLTRFARSADFHVSIVDPRPSFATRLRQPDADDLLLAWPQDVLPAMLAAADAAVVMAHDVKIDLPALRCALDSSVPYVGALGSRRSQKARRESLAELGYAEEVLDRVHGPVGLDLGAVTNSEIACAILAEVLGALNGRSGRSLSRCGIVKNDRRDTASSVSG